MKVDEIVRTVCLSISLLISLSGFIVALIKDLKSKGWDQLKSALIQFIEKAELITTYTGAEKKQAVLDWADDYCQAHNIKFNAKKVGDQIEELITFSKKVNNNDDTQTS